MNPFSKKLTREERSKIWNGCDPLLTHMLGSSEQDFLDATTCETSPEIVPARSLTAVEKAEQDSELNRLSLFGGAYAPREYSSIPAIAALEKARERQDLEKLLGQQRVESPLDEMISKAVEEAITVLTKRHVPSEHERESLVIRKGGRIEVDGNECTEYGADGGLLRSWVGTPSDRPSSFESLAK